MYCKNGWHNLIICVCVCSSVVPWCIRVCVGFIHLFSLFFRVHVHFISHRSSYASLARHHFKCLYFLYCWLHYDTLTTAIIISMRLQIAYNLKISFIKSVSTQYMCIPHMLSITLSHSYSVTHVLTLRSSFHSAAPPPPPPQSRTHVNASDNIHRVCVRSIMCDKGTCACGLSEYESVMRMKTLICTHKYERCVVNKTWRHMEMGAHIFKYVWTRQPPTGNTEKRRVKIDQKEMESAMHKPKICIVRKWQTMGPSVRCLAIVMPSYWLFRVKLI